jgi:hypothetical protein
MPENCHLRGVFQPLIQISLAISLLLLSWQGLNAQSPEREDVAVEVLASSSGRFEARVQFPEARLMPAQGADGTAFVQLLIPGVENNDGLAGHPDVPAVHRILAVPKGATARTMSVSFQVADEHKLLLFPVQSEAADSATSQGVDNGESMPPPEWFMDLPFEFDPAAYAAEGLVPASIVEVRDLGTLRDLEIVQVSIAAAQYEPAQTALQTFSSVQFSITFEDGEDWFLPGERVRNPFERHFDATYAQVLNYPAVREHIGPGELVSWHCPGEELMIVTDPAFRPAADQLRDWKVEKGIATRVFETGSGAGLAGTTAAQIRDFVRDRYDNCLVRPSYLLLLGDADHIPPFYLTTHYGDSAGSDLPYGQLGGFSILPQIAIGRMPVRTLAQAQVIVDKTIAYEKTPPNVPAFYGNVSLASYFQCCRTNVDNPGTTSRSFIETSELVRNALASSYTVERIYSTSTTYHNDYAGDTTPRRYRNGTLLPAALGGNSGFAWSGSTTDVVNAVNTGRFLMMHRGHGGVNGWGSPSFRSTHLSQLDNAALTPVMYSINCASGLWDNETLDPDAQNWNYGTSVSGAYWAERILRMEGGAVGIIGDVRNSPTWANSALARGLFDATFPQVLPNVGSNTPIRRLGDILNYGKTYLANQIGVAQSAGSVSAEAAVTNLILYHVLGDPTLTLWTSYPYQIRLPNLFTDLHQPEPNVWELRYPVEGAIITALKNGEPVARGMVEDNEVRLEFIRDVDSRGGEPKHPITLSADFPNAVATALDLAIFTDRFETNQ